MNIYLLINLMHAYLHITLIYTNRIASCSCVCMHINTYIIFLVAYNMMTEIASENGPVFQIIVPAVILVIIVLILGVGTVLFIVCRVRRQRHKPVSYNNHNDTQLKR